MCLWAAIILYLDQILMANTTVQLTAEELASIPDNGKRCELVNGVLRMMSPAGGRHGRIAGQLLLRVGNHVEQQLGATFAAETGFLLHRNPDTVRAPDVAFVSHERLGEYADHDGFLPLAPDLVAEVVSPSDQSSEVESKATAWLQAGVRVVLVVDPQTNSIREYRSPAQIQVYRDGASTWEISWPSSSWTSLNSSDDLPQYCRWFLAPAPGAGEGGGEGFCISGHVLSSSFALFFGVRRLGAAFFCLSACFDVDSSEKRSREK